MAVALSRAAHAGLDWATVQALSDDALEERVYGVRSPVLPRSLDDGNGVKPV